MKSNDIAREYENRPNRSKFKRPIMFNRFGENGRKGSPEHVDNRPTSDNVSDVRLDNNSLNSLGGLHQATFITDRPSPNGWTDIQKFRNGGCYRPAKSPRALKPVAFCEGGFRYVNWTTGYVSLAAWRKTLPQLTQKFAKFAKSEFWD